MRKPNWKGMLVGAAIAAFAVACSEVAGPNKGPGGPSYGRGGGSVSGTIYYTGQGFTLGDLNDQRCGLPGETPADDGGTGLFANWNGLGQPYQPGQAYLVWVLNGLGPVMSATLYLPDGPHPMIVVGSTLKFASQYWPPSALTGVYATYNAGSANNPQLVVSHGCPGLRRDLGVFCSPGFWKNALDGAWQLIGYADAATGNAALFNSTVVPSFYDTPSGANPTLGQVLNTPGANTFGAASGPYGLNAFNATGAYLTNLIPGFSFSIDAYNNYVATGDDNCPIDHFGNYLP